LTSESDGGLSGSEFPLVEGEERVHGAGSSEGRRSREVFDDGTGRRGEGIVPTRFEIVRSGLIESFGESLLDLGSESGEFRFGREEGAKVLLERVDDGRVVKILERELHRSQVDSLKNAVEVGSEEETEDVIGFRGLASRDECERLIRRKGSRLLVVSFSSDTRERSMTYVDSLVSHLSRLNVSADGVGEETKFRGVGSGCDITSLSVVVGRRILSGKAGRESSVHRTVEEFCELCETHLSDLLKTETSLLGSRGDGGSHKVT